MRIVEINPENPQQHKIKQIAEVLKAGGIIIYPTDSVYAFGCDLYNQAAVELICQIREEKVSKSMFSFICKDISQVSEYARQFDNRVFKTMKSVLPGPYTFILNASHKVPKIIQAKKKTVGVRIPSHNIPLAIVEGLGNPMITSTVKIKDNSPYAREPWYMAEYFNSRVDIVIDGGSGLDVVTTILDCTGDEIEVIREGLGAIDFL